MTGTYETEVVQGAKVTRVDAGHGRIFLVIQSDNKLTMVLGWDSSLDCWISRKHCDPSVDPIQAVTGLLLGPQDIGNPITLLKKQLEVERRVNARLMGETRRSVKAKTRPGPGERGKRGGRNP